MNAKPLFPTAPVAPLVVAGALSPKFDSTNLAAVIWFHTENPSVTEGSLPRPEVNREPAVMLDNAGW